MKKRLVLALLAIFLMCVLSSCGKKKEVSESATEQVELAPLEEKAVEPALESQVPQSDPNAVGNIVYYPNSNEYLGALAGSNALTLYFENSGVESGSGRVSVYDEGDYSLLAYADVSETASCRMSPIDNNGMQLSGWSDGTQATLFFSKPFEAEHGYFVLMDAGCFTHNGVESLAITNPSLMTIKTKPYGVASEIRDRYNFGDTATLSVVVGGDCKRVLIQDYDSDAVLPSQTMLTSSGDVYFTFMKEGTWDFKVSFYDDSVEIDSVTYHVSVAPTAAEVNHDTDYQAIQDTSGQSYVSQNTAPSGNGGEVVQEGVADNAKNAGTKDSSSGITTIN